MQQTVWIIGANADVGLACAHRFRNAGYAVVLFGHRSTALPSDFEHHFLDVAQPDLSVFDNREADIVLFTAGRLPHNETALFGHAQAEAIAVNFSGNVRIAGHLADRFRKRGHGLLIGVSSVAAVRGKGSNVIYGAAKAGWDAYLSGLRNFLHPTGVRVLTIRPGYIATKMTAHLPLPPLLTVSADRVAATVVRHAQAGNRSIVYVKPVWRLLAFVVKHMPESLAKRLKW